MTVKTFATKAEAETEAKTMRGWKIKIIQFSQRDNPKADADGNVWAIQCNGNQYMQTDGYVR